MPWRQVVQEIITGGGMTDTISLAVHTDAWAGGHTTGGTTPPTNPANAQGQRDGTVATVKAGGLAAGTSILTLTTFSPPTAGVSPQLRLFFQITLGTLELFQVAYTPQGLSEVLVVNDAVARNHLTNPLVVDLSGLTQAQIAGITVRFQHNATTPSTGGSMPVDAVAIRRTETL